MPAPLLALDTSTVTARVAIVDATGARLAGGEQTAARHASGLLGLCDEVLRAAGLDVAGLGGVACGAGPGSFTGLRVGFAIGKGLALPTDLPFLTVSSLEALAVDLAAETNTDALLVPCLDAGKEQVYARPFAARAGVLTPLHPGGAYGAAELCAWLGAIEPALPRLTGGSGVDRYGEIFRERLGARAVVAGAAGPSAVAVARLALPRYLRGERDDLETAVPLYGRAPDITTPKRPPPK